MSENLGRRITHINITEEEIAADMCAAGMDGTYARSLAELDTYVKTGGEERLNDTVLRLIGKEPKRFQDYVQQSLKQGIWRMKEIQ